MSVEEGIEEYLKPSYFAESDDKEIQSLSHKIIGKKMGKDAVIAIFKWVRDTFIWDIVPNTGAKSLICRESKRAVCVDKVNLFISLVRSIGIPARYVVVYDADIENKVGLHPFHHMYAEVYLDDKWIEADVTFGRHESKMFEPSKFGEHKWKTSTKLDRMSGLSKEFITFANEAQKKDPNAKILKENIDKYSG